jgi:hypothetical protein
MREARKGKFKPKNPEKYVGNVNNIIYRSSWELKFLKYLDSHPHVLKYASEELAIPYLSPVDGKYHRYFPDFVVQMKMPDESVKTMMIEIKPYAQTIPPVVTEGKRRNKRKLMNEFATYAVNSAKWEAAERYCAEKNWEFKKFTEAELNIR